MAVTIQAPLAAQLFSLGQAANVGGGDTQFKGDKKAQPQGFSTGHMVQPPQQQSGGGKAGAMANLAGAVAGKYMQAQSGAVAPDANGNGFGLGGDLVNGDAGSAQYAGTQKASLSTLFNQPEAQMPVDNGYQDSSPYALKYTGGKSSLFNYGGSYGGATY